MSAFSDGMAVVLHHEGGLSNDPSDPGGMTKYGVSLRWLEKEGLDLNADGKVDKFDVLGLTIEEASALYREHFWDAMGLDRLTFPKVAIKIFDCSVNTGTRRASIFAQTAVGVAADGILGRRSIAAINSVPSDGMLARVCRIQHAFYQGLVARRPELGRFMPGWSKRAAWPWQTIEGVPTWIR